MNRPFEVRFMEPAYLRNVRFAIELLDSVTLARVSEGVEVVAEGLQGGPIVNSSGLFVWLQEHTGILQRLTINPRMLPYDIVERAPSELTQPLTTIELPPRVNYPFAAGVTGLRGRLIERRVPPPRRPTPVQNAEVQLRWLDEYEVWRDAPPTSRTYENGAFAAVLRFAPNQVPHLNADGT